MITIVICALIGLAFGILMKDAFAVVAAPIITGGIGFTFALLGNAVVTPAFKQYTITYEIVALNDNAGSSGWYMALTPTMSYVMYIKTGDGYKLITQNNGATVRFDKVNPRIEFTYREGIPDNADNFLVFRVDKRRRLMDVVIYVPENSIKKDFILDAK